MKFVEPGIDTSAKVNTREIGSDERAILQHVKEVWRVVEFNRAPYKNTDYKFAIGKPTKIPFDDFHLERDILILFASQKELNVEKFSDALDWIFTVQLKDKEIDKFCVVLIAKDQGTEAKIREITNEKPDFRTVIPFSYDELLALDIELSSTYIARRLRNIFATRDLFNNRNPLEKDTYFFGRQEVIQKLYSRYKRGEHSGLFGLQKIGKTSVLKALIRRLEYNKETVVYIECQLFYEKRWYEFLCLIIKKILESLQNSTQAKYKAVKILLEALDVETLEYQDNNAVELVSRHLNQIYQATKKTRILIVLDEVENITFGLSSEEHWREGEDYRKFWQKIRGISQSNSSLFSFIVCGINPSITERHSLEEKGSSVCLDNPIRLLIDPIYLSGFDATQVQEMICCIGKYIGLDFDDNVIISLANEYGGNPFLIRQACSEIHQISGKDRPTCITAAFYESNSKKINLAVREVVDSILDTLKKYYKEEYDLCTFLANGEYSFFNDFATSSRDFIRHAERYGLIYEREGRYEFRIQVVKDRLREISSKPSVPSTSVAEKSHIELLTAKRETGTVEFKSTLRWNVRGGKTDKQMEQEVIKAIASFMNTNGGTLLIGVEDSGKIAGLENDYKAWGNKANPDIVLRYLANEVMRNSFTIGLSCQLCKFEILQIDGKHILQVLVERSKRPIVVQYSGKECFFIRNGSSSPKLLNAEEREKYCREHFN